MQSNTPNCLFCHRQEPTARLRSDVRDEVEIGVGSVIERKKVALRWKGERRYRSCVTGITYSTYLEGTLVLYLSGRGPRGTSLVPHTKPVASGGFHPLRQMSIEGRAGGPYERKRANRAEQMDNLRKQRPGVRVLGVGGAAVSTIRGLCSTAMDRLPFDLAAPSPDLMT